MGFEHLIPTISFLFTALITISTLLQGINAYLDLRAKFKRNGQDKQSVTVENASAKKKTKLNISLPRLRWTQSRIDFLMMAVPWYTVMLLEIVPVYLYIPSIDLLDKLMVMFSYFTFYLVYPFIIKNVKEKSNKKFLKLALIALALEFFLANILYLMPSLKEDSGFTFIYITAHTINFQIFRISLLFYLIREFFDPWYETLPKN